MDSVTFPTFSNTEARIVTAAIGVFLRYGAKKTTMADIAEAAGVSRQTVYASFGDKDGIIVACVRHVSEASFAAMRERLVGCQTLGDKLDVYFEETVIKSFEMLREAGDPQDLISGHSPAGKAAIAESHARQAALVAAFLTPYRDALAETGQTPDQLATFIVTAGLGLKHGPENRSALDALLQSLKAGVLAVAKAD